MATIFDRTAGLAPARTVFDRQPAMTAAEQEAQSAQNYAATTGAFGQGVTRGVRGLKAGFNNFGGTVAEVANSQPTADELYAAAARQNELSAAETPDIPALDQVHDLGSGARYIAGAVGQGIPYIAPAVLGTTGTKMLGGSNAAAAAVGTATNVAPMVGGVQERLRADPVTAKLSPLERASIAGTEGLAGAALNEIIPLSIAKKAVGNTASKGILRDTLTAAGGEGAANAAQEALGQHVQSALNPSRDTSGDGMALLDAGIQGAAGMAPLALPHAIAGNTAGSVIQAVKKAEPRDWVKERLARSKDLDYTTVHAPQVAPAGMDTTAKHEWLQQDDAARNAAAENLAQRYTTDPETPVGLHNAAKSFLKGAKTTDAWKQLYSAAKTDQQVSAVKDGLTTFADSFKARVDNGIAGAKEALASRENAQTPLVDGSFDSLLADKLYAHTGVTNSNEILQTLPKTVSGMKQWVSNGFSLAEGGDVTVPRGLDKAFKDPAAAVQDAYDLMVKQGLVSPMPKELKEAMAQMKTNAEAKKTDGSIIEDNLLPTAQAEHKFSGADHVQIANEVRRMISTGKFNDEALTALFGANKETVLEALDKNSEKPKHAEQAEKKAQESDDLSYEEQQAMGEVGGASEYHGVMDSQDRPYKSDNTEHMRHAQIAEDTLSTTGRAVKRVGIVDAMREKYADRPEAFVKALTDYIAENKDSLVTDAEKANPDEALNAKHFLLRSENAGDKAESIDIPGRELNVLNPDSRSNKWAEKIGKNREFADISHGKVFFERLKYDGKGAVDHESGEIGPSRTEFATSTNKLIARMRGAKKEGAFSDGKQGLEEQHNMLRAGISAMLSSKDTEGRSMISRVGVVDKPGGAVRWLGAKDDLPAGLKLPSRGTIADVKVEAKNARVDELKKLLKPQLEKFENVVESLKEQVKESTDKSEIKKLNESLASAQKVLEALRAATKSGEEKALRALVDKHVTDGQYDERTKQSTGQSETQDMADSAEKAVNNKVRTHDEQTGAELHPRTRAPEKTQEQVQSRETMNKQVSYLMSTLRGKGIPAFSKLAEKLNPEQLGTMRDVLGKMLEAKTPDNPIWNGKPPKNFTEFGNRTRAALARLEGYQSKIEATVAEKFSEQAIGAEPISKEEQATIRADIEKKLGKDVAVDFADKILGSKGKEISGEWKEGLIRISMNAHNPAQVGAHESMHELFSRLTKGSETAQRVKDILTKAASSAPVLRQLERLLEAHPEALKQIKEGAPHSLEERLAYMYQFWHAGLVTIGPETKSTFQKIADFLRRTVGRLSDDQKAERLLQAFDEGKTPTADAAAEVLHNNLEYRERLINKSFETMKPVIDKLARFTLPSEAILMRSDNPHLQAMLRDFKNPTGEGVVQSNIEAKGQKMAQYMNRFAALTRGYESKDLELAAKYLREGKAPTDNVAREIYDGTHKLLSDMETYMREADVKTWNSETKKWEDFGHIKSYFPQSYDLAKITKDSAGFIAKLLEHHTPELEAIAKEANSEVDSDAAVPSSYASALAKDTGKTVTAEDVAKAITDRIIMASGHTDLNESTAIVGYSPFARAVNRRTLTFLDQSKFHEWMNNDLTNVVTSYIAQGVKRAEYVRRFGNGGEGLTARMEQAFEFEKERIAAADPKLTETQVTEKALTALEGPAKAVMALEGTIGYDIDPSMRRLQGTIMAYENLRTMGLSLFSAIIDPLGVIVRGGEMKDAMQAYSRSLKEVWATWNGVHTEDADAKLAEFLGTVDAGGFLANFGQAYSSMYLHQKVRKWNEALFHYNGMDGFNRGVRIQATQAAISFIKRQITDPTVHSKRYLDELVLKKGDVKIDDNGDLNYNDPKIQVAIKRWVDQAILRPNAAHRPTWMSDPHYAIFGHMKQFSYTFHDTIMKRVWNEAKEHGNLAPMGVLLGAFTPMMVASDLAKSILLTGDTPSWAKEGLVSTIDHGARRAGLLGLSQPYADPMISGHPAGMAGPAAEQLFSMLTQPFGESMVDALPGSSVINTMHGGGKMELMADD